MASKELTNYSIVIESTQTASEKVCKDVLSRLKNEDFGQDDIFAVHLALEEALANAIKHGNKMSTNKEIKVDCSIDAGKIEISITDAGKGFNPESVPDPREGENIYKPNGRGLLLIRSYMDTVEFNRKGNCMHMIKYKEKKKIVE